MEKFHSPSKKCPANKFAPKELKWQAHERDVAKSFKGRQTPGSGNKPGHKGDVKSASFLVEAKSTDSRFWTFKAEWLEKISEEALGRSRWPAMAIRMDGATCERDWVMMPVSVFKRILEIIEDVGCDS